MKVNSELRSIINKAKKLLSANATNGVPIGIFYIKELDYFTFWTVGTVRRAGVLWKNTLTKEDLGRLVCTVYPENTTITRN